MRLLLFAFSALFFVACSSGDPSAEPTCEAGQQLCAGACIDPLADPLHCGGCQAACAAGEVCSAGSCAGSCPEGRTDCAGACVDLAGDAANCGGCGVSCGGELSCVDGGCVCGDGLVDCDGACIDTRGDSANCGACGQVCEAGESCIAGSCTAACGGALIDCGGCVDSASDPAHCGGCGNACAAGQECNEGVCGCPAGTLECGAECIAVGADVSNCGACGIICPAGDHAEAPVCVDGACAFVCEAGWSDCDGAAANGCEARLEDDAAHCGACGNECGSGSYCAAGICCGEEGLICGGSCIDPMADDAHCGGCDSGCAGWPESSGGSCDGGSCELACYGGFGDCNGDREDGCESALADDAANCGACGNACGALCSESACLSISLPPKTFGHQCVLLSDGSAHCWGFNSNGQLGDGTNANALAPTRVPVSGVVEIATDQYHSCVRTADGPVRCFGKNDRGQLGAGNNFATLLPQLVMDGTAPLAGATQLAITDGSSCALLGTGRVVCWGRGQHGRLGNGGVADSLDPVEVLDGVLPLENVVEIAAGTAHVCARLGDGTLRCWGNNSNGQLGQGDSGSATARNSATAVPGILGAHQVVAAGHRTCVRIGGTAKCWGQNLNGQAGDGTTDPVNKTSPVDVVGLSSAVQLHVAMNHGCALLSDGSARCWGMNNLGQLGDRTPANAMPTPVVVLDPAGNPWTDLKAIGAGMAQTCAVTTNDRMYCWGMNAYGQLGDGTTNEQGAPVPVLW